MSRALQVRNCLGSIEEDPLPRRFAVLDYDPIVFDSTTGVLMRHRCGAYDGHVTALLCSLKLLAIERNVSRQAGLLVFLQLDGASRSD